MEQILPLFLLALIFYLLIFRPMRARSKEIANIKLLQDSLQPGTKIMMASGIFGTVRGVNEDQIILEIAPGTNITIAKGAVAQVEVEDAGPLPGYDA